MIRSGFFNSKNHDKQYYASDISRLFNSMITEGVFGNVGEKFIAKPGNGMKVIIPSGMAWFNSTWTMNDSDEIINLDEAPYVSNYKRIDGIFLKIYPVSDTNVRDNTIYYMKGTETIGAPEKPVPTITDNEMYIPLCYITVNYGTTAITASMIENCVGLSSCPFITGILETVDASELIDKWESQFNDWLDNKHYEFENWFANIQYVLDGDAAGHLQNEIDDLRKRTITNMLKPTLATRTLGGVTCTNNGDGTYTINGTSTEWAVFDLNCSVNLKAGVEYRLTGCPTGGSGSTYKIGVYNESLPTTQQLVAQDLGNGITFTVAENGIYDIHIPISPNVTVENLLFKPMLTTDTIATYVDFVPYSGGGNINENLATIKDNLTSASGVPFIFGIDGNGDYGYYKQGETSVTPFRNRHTETYKPAVRANNLDMGLYHKKRYVDTTGVPNANSNTYTVTSNGTKDMGETNTNRYVEVNVLPSVITAGGVSNSNQISVVNGGYYFVQIFEGDHLNATFYVDGGTILNRSGTHSSMDTGKGGGSELLYIKATSNTLLIHDGDHKVSGIYATNYMRVG